MGIEEFLLQRAEEQGKRKGTEKMKTKFVKNLIKLTDFSNERIASLVDVNVAFYEKIRANSPVKSVTI
jgi:hypothetical protein